MKMLLINADDFGMTESVTSGISESMLRGAVTTTSAMACVPGSLERVAAHAAGLQGRIGLHLQLTDGVPCRGDVPSLVDEEGQFPRAWWSIRNPAAEEIRREWHAQMERMLSFGVQPSHIDTHHSVHRIPEVFEVYAEMAAEYGLPARTLTAAHTIELRRRGVPCTDALESGWYGEGITPEGLVARVERAFAVSGRGSVELMCHPGYSDEELGRSSTYVEERQRELGVLCDPELPKLLERAGILVAQARGDRECER